MRAISARRWTDGSKNSDRAGRYYNGCFDSEPTTSTGTTWSCSGTVLLVQLVGRQLHLLRLLAQQDLHADRVPITGAPYTHNWIVNNHSTWSGCIMDRDQDYDTKNTTPTTVGHEIPCRERPVLRAQQARHAEL